MTSFTPGEHAQRNWAGNVTYRAARLHEPRTPEDVQDVVRAATRVRALGTRHSFNDVADTTGDLVSCRYLNRVVAFDESTHSITVEGGVRYGEVCRFLHDQGFALHNLASLPHISVAGACATGTHGSGDRAGSLATAVTALEFVTADGSVLNVSRQSHPDVFPGMVVSLGALGIVTKLTLRVEPTFLVRQDVYERLGFEVLEGHLDDLTSGGDSVSFFTDWQDEVFHQVWLKRRVTSDMTFEPEGSWFGATLATRDWHPLPHLSAAACTPQLGVPGPWHERLPHFRLDFTPSVGEELQTEYLLPRRHVSAALRALRTLRERFAPVLLVSEVRTIAADDLWLSPCFEEECVGIHFTWRADEPSVRALLPLLEDTLAPFEARPHWGKMFLTPPSRLREVFVKLPAFRALVEEHDQGGKFRNDFLQRVLFDE